MIEMVTEIKVLNIADKEVIIGVKQGTEDDKEIFIKSKRITLDAGSTLTIDNSFDLEGIHSYLGKSKGGSR